MLLKLKLSICLVLFAVLTHAQKKWSLTECVQFAMDSNVSIRQSKIQGQVAAINYKESRLSLIPTLNSSNSVGYRFGKSQNPSTGILENQNYFQIGLQLQSSTTIFNFFSKRNTILANEWSLQAANAATDKLKNDIGLQVANAYLQVLLDVQQEQVAAVQVQQSTAQLDITRKQVTAGALPELNAVELESQLANDSATFISAEGNVTQAKYVLKSYMGLDAAAPFEIEEPPVDQIPVEAIADLQPDYVYELALKNQPQQQYNLFNLRAAQKSSLAARGALYPSITAFGSLGTNYGFYRTPIYQEIVTGYTPTGLVVSDGMGGYSNVLQPILQNGAKSGYSSSPGLGTQFSNNFGQTIGVGLSIPLFNGWQSKASYERSKLNIQSLEDQITLDNQTLKQNIFQAYNAAVVALEKLNSSKKQVESSQQSYDFAMKRYTVGMLSTLELITDQNTLFSAKLQYVSNQFDYVFKMKVLEFYKGNGIKL